jgi:hypothetical protein
MIEIMRTNDIVLISAVQAALDEVDVPFFIADSHMSVLEGSLGFLPRRVLVLDEDVAQARRILVGAGFGEHLLREGGSPA